MKKSEIQQHLDIIENQAQQKYEFVLASISALRTLCAMADCVAEGTAAITRKPAPKVVTVETQAPVQATVVATASVASNGSRPKWKQALATVMGKQVMSASEVLTALNDKGWAPSTPNPKTYVSMMLSSNKDLFQSVARGTYRVLETGTGTKTPKVSKAAGAKTLKKLQDAGVDPTVTAADPFEG